MIADAPMSMQTGLASLRRHGRTFYAASMFFDAQTSADVAQLYGFCRVLDDLVDLASDQNSAARALDILRREFATDSSDHVLVLQYRNAARRHALPDTYALRLIDGIALDLTQTRYAKADDLLSYCFGVAGIVGMMMCPLLRAKDASARPPAIALGVAMQLTNIARDVVEDARRGRLYLPLELFSVAPDIAAIAAADPAACSRSFAVVKIILAWADAFYLEADQGMAYLPLRSRIAIVAASRMYQAIGHRLLARGESAFGAERVSIGAGQKFLHCVGAIAFACIASRHADCQHHRLPPVLAAELARLTG